MKNLPSLCYALPLLIAAGSTLADDSKSNAKQDTKPAATDADQAALFQHFKKTLSGVKLVGHFTIVGKDNAALPKEEYTIESVEKLPDGDYWLFKTRIKYGNKDATLPLPLEVKWAGKTPVITLTDFTVPGMGTFSARVVIYNKKYAGTWKHGEVGGHLFGVIDKLDDAKADEKKAP